MFLLLVSAFFLSPVQFEFNGTTPEMTFEWLDVNVSGTYSKESLINATREDCSEIHIGITVKGIAMTTKTCGSSNFNISRLQSFYANTTDFIEIRIDIHSMSDERKDERMSDARKDEREEPGFFKVMFVVFVFSISLYCIIACCVSLVLAEPENSELFPRLVAYYPSTTIQKNEQIDLVERNYIDYLKHTKTWSDDWIQQSINFVESEQKRTV